MKKRDLVLGMLQILVEQQPQRSNPFYLCKRFEPSIHVSFCCGILLTVVLHVEFVVGVESHFVLTTFHGEKNTRL